MAETIQDFMFGLPSEEESGVNPEVTARLREQVVNALGGVQGIHLTPQNVDALINAFLGSAGGTAQEGFSQDELNEMTSLFDRFADPEAAIVDPQAAEEINARLAEAGVTDHSFTTDPAGEGDVIFAPTGGAPGPGDDDVEQPTGGTGPAPGILRGGDLVRINRQGQRDTWAMMYPTDTGTILFQFDSLEQVEQTFGPDWSTRVPWRQISEEQAQSSLGIGDAAEVIGVEGQWRALWEDMKRQAAGEAGVQDPTIWGDFVSQPDVQEVLAAAVTGELSNQAVQAALRNTDSYTTVLYPGIDRFFGRSTNPERLWQDYFRKVSRASESLGIDVRREDVGRLIEEGVSDDAFAVSAPLMARARSSQDFFNILNQWVEADLGKSLDFETWFDFVRGQAPADIQDVAERAQLQFAAEQVGADFADQEFINRLAEGADFTEAQARSGFLSAARLVRQLDRATRLNKYGLTDDDLAALEVGIQPKSGRSLDEIATRVDQAITEEGLLGESKGRFFTGFTPEGLPTKPGLQPLSPTRA